MSDPSNEVVEVLIQCMEWNMAVDLLDILQENLPDKTGEKGKWNFEKAPSILHKVQEIVLWGNSDNPSCQAPEVIFLFVLIHPWHMPEQTLYIWVHTEFVLVLSARPYREYQDCGEPHQQQGCVHVHSLLPCSGWIYPDL